MLLASNLKTITHINMSLQLNKRTIFIFSKFILLPWSTLNLHSWGWVTWAMYLLWLLLQLLCVSARFRHMCVHQKWNRVYTYKDLTARDSINKSSRLPSWNFSLSQNFPAANAKPEVSFSPESPEGLESSLKRPMKLFTWKSHIYLCSPFHVDQ